MWKRKGTLPKIDTYLRELLRDSHQQREIKPPWKITLGESGLPYVLEVSESHLILK